MQLIADLHEKQPGLQVLLGYVVSCALCPLVPSKTSFDEWHAMALLIYRVSTPYRSQPWDNATFGT